MEWLRRAPLQRRPAPLPIHLHRLAHPLRDRLRLRRQSSRQAAIALDALCQLLPKPPRFVLSDNGSEFMGDFQQRLDTRGITHWPPCPQSSKMNAHAERLDRTIQEQFVDYHEDELFYDLAGFNRKLANWLLDYNTVLPHHSLGLQSPATSSSTINQSAKACPRESGGGGGLIHAIDSIGATVYKFGRRAGR